MVKLLGGTNRKWSRRLRNQYLGEQKKKKEELISSND